jgi:hypothetical protein
LIPAIPFEWVLPLLVLQAVLGAADTLVDHEWRARLPTVPGAAPELRLHALRSSLYAALFAMAALADWHGRWALLPLAVSAAEIATTARDTVIEYRIRTIDAPERVLHLFLLLNTGAYTLLLGLAAFSADRLVPASPDGWRVLLGLAAVGALASATRDALAARLRARTDGPQAAGSTNAARTRAAAAR